MPPVVVRLTAKNIEQALTRTPWALVRLDRSPRPVLHRGLADVLDARFPGNFTFGLLSRPDLRPEVLNDLFRTALGPLRGGVKDGYLLLEDGLVVGHHGAETRPDSVRYDSDAPVEEKDPIIRELARSSPREAEALRQLLAYLLPVVARKQQAAGYRSTPMSDGPRESTRETRPPPPPPPAPPPAPDADDPYVVLGVTPSATDDELKDAWRTQLKLNHPDKVAHLSPALQKFAEQQTLAVMRAYDAIVAKRRR